MLPTDWVFRHCVSKDRVKCSMKARCPECKKEIEDIINIDEVLNKRIAELENFLRMSRKKNSPA